jgi:hypothetical protein
MTKAEEILNSLRSVHWGAAPKSANREDLDGATTYLQMFARFILENQPDANRGWTPFASPLEVLLVEDVHVQQGVANECQRLTAQSPLVYDKVFVTRALEWAALCETGHPSTLGRENMFDPLIGLVINRVPAIIRKGHWVVDESMFPLQDWVNRYSME